MARLVSGFLLLLSSLCAYAQQSREAVNEPPVEPNDLGIALFAAIFVGVCVVFAWMVWRNHKREQQKHGKAQKQSGA